MDKAYMDKFRAVLICDFSCELALTFTYHSLTDVQYIFANHGYFDAKNFVAITGDNLGEEFQVPDFS